ncbi:ribonuclease HII [Candidatus Micrarchaeota archaeon]|jgi:ribonuclease HII|nr:ribonuclease HII [Candidatus Micrarchaeota archaeon]
MLVGIDEAGRGCVFGPLVIAAVADSSTSKLFLLGLKDSKLLSPSKRKSLFQEIKNTSIIEYVIIPAKKLNTLMNKMSLNQIEFNYMVQVLKKINYNNKIERVYIDCPENNTKKFSYEIRRKSGTEAEIIAEHKADSIYPIVSAASIIAKVIRDEEIEKIKQELGFDFNSGYSSDEITQKFLKENYKDPKVLQYVRTKWSTYTRLLEKTKQTKLEF